jgi:tetratricopeptide (TPR) repeat protein
MKAMSDQWVIRTADDQVKGPYSTEDLKNMIIAGQFNGTEEVCEYPQGEWHILTKKSEFYDALLESIENPAEAFAKRKEKTQAETVIQGPRGVAAGPNTKDPGLDKKPFSDEIPKFDLKEFVEKEMKEQADLKSRQVTEKEKKQKAVLEKEKAVDGSENKVKAGNIAVQPSTANNQVILPPERIDSKNSSTNSKKDIIDERDKNLEIQMTDLRKLKQNEFKKVAPLLVVLALLIGAAAYIFLEDQKPKATGWQLLAPAKNSGETLSEAEVKELKKAAVRAFQEGKLEEILQAQLLLIKAIQGSPRDLESMGFLCMAHYQLLPHTQQTDQDSKSILTVTQIARTVNPISNYSESCQVVHLLAKGQAKEARSLLEKTLDNQVDERFSLPPFLYYIKGEMLEYERNFINAEAYYDQAAKLWPQWSTARFALARILYKQEKYSQARDEFEKLSKEYPDHKGALYGLGLVELQTTKNLDKAMNFFAGGFKIDQRMNKDFHAQATLRYAKLLLDKNDQKLALLVAEQGYRTSPSNRDLKELVVSLGGEEKIENANSEIVLLGDQFARAGDHLTAQAQYKAAFEVDPKNGMAAYKAAKSLWIINQTREAVNWLEKAINADPNLLRAYVLKADYESQRFNFVGAAKTLSAAQNRFLQSHEVVKAQALLEFRKNNMFGAILYGERAVRIYDADVELLTLLAQAHIFIFLNAPNTRKEDQDRNEQSIQAARRYAGRAIDLEPAWPESQITYAKLLAAIEGAVRGEVYLKELIKTYPYTIEYRIALAEFYKQYEKFSDSAKIYEEIVSIDPKNKKANFGLAESYRILNKIEQAQNYYNITSTLDPSDVEPMFANAKLLIETASGREAQAKTQQALAKLEIVKKINPEFPKVSFFMARCYLELSDYDKATEMIKEEKVRNPNIADSYILAAEIYYRRAQFKECAAEYSSAIRLRPKSAELYVKASTCYRNSDAVDIAEDMLAMAAERESGFAEIYREMGYIEMKKGNASKAVDNFKKYQLLSPNAPDRDTVSAEIKRLGGG